MRSGGGLDPEGRAMVFPLYDDNPFKRARVPVVTWGLLALNVAIFLYQVSVSELEIRAFLASFGATPAAVLRNVPQEGQVPVEVTLLTYMFLHGGWEHIIGNMVYLWVFGDDIEDALGPARFILFYLAIGIASAVGYSALNPESTTPLVGASGSISGILAAYLLLRPCARVSIFFFRMIIRVRAYWVIGGWILLQLFHIVSQASDGVAYSAHGAGLVAGAILFLIMRPAGVPLLQCVEQPGEETAAG
jgi:membrane associated rhomboid family serine protease